MRQSTADGAAGAEQPRPVVHVAEAHRPPGTIAKPGLELLSTVADEPHDVGNSLRAKQIDLVFGKRAAGDGDERFGESVGGWTEPGCQPAGKDRDRQAHASSTFVPSKSKRNRTSSRPARPIAARSRRWSSE